MSDLIDREELLHIVGQMPLAWEYGQAVSDIYDIIKNQPTIEAVPVVHGEWLLRHIGHGHMWECSVCHKRPDIYVKQDTNFCPNCGADMRKGGA